jgi:hypothetical protein
MELKNTITVGKFELHLGTNSYTVSEIGTNKVEYFNTLAEAVLLGLSHIKNKRVEKLKTLCRSIKKIDREEVKHLIDFTEPDHLGNVHAVKNGKLDRAFIATPKALYQRHYVDAIVRTWDWEDLDLSKLLIKMKEITDE